MKQNMQDLTEGEAPATPAPAQGGEASGADFCLKSHGGNAEAVLRFEACQSFY